MSYGYKCNICQAAFSNMDAIWKHYNDVHIKEQYICRRCPEEFTDKVTFNAHWLAEHKDVPNMESFTRNIEMSNSSNQFPPKLFTTFISSDQQWRENMPEAPVQAGTSQIETPRITIKLPRKSRTFTHAKIKSKRKTSDPADQKDRIEEFETFIEYFKFMEAGDFSCHICKKRLSCRQSLIGHVTALHGTQNLTRPLREQSKYIRREILAEIRSESCSRCMKEFLSRRQVDIHFAEQHSLNIFRCVNPSCAEVFLEKDARKKHMKNTVDCFSYVLNNPIFAAKKLRYGQF